MAKYQDPLVVAPSDGVTPGDDRSYPNRGTEAGMVGRGAPYGADTSLKAKNRMGSAHLAPDAMDECCPPGGGDFTSSSRSGESTLGNGMGIHGASGSDPMMDTTPGDEGRRGDRD